MSNQERKAKILEVTRDRFMTLAEITRALGLQSNARQYRASIDEMVKAGQMEKGKPVKLANQATANTYRAKAEATVEVEQKAEVFHGRAPSVFEWRGNFGLRS